MPKKNKRVTIKNIILQFYQLNNLTTKDLNNTKNAEMEIIVFNRVAKSGSESMMDLLYRLGKLHRFVVSRNGPKKHHSATLSSKMQFLKANNIANLEEPAVYIEHFNYINFTDFKLPKPIYINLVRDPVERMISWFYYVRSPWYNVLRHKRFPDLPMKSEEWYKKNFNDCVRNGDPECRYEQFAIAGTFGDYRRQSIFFCGHKKDCLPFNSPVAVEMAKQIVDKEYAVVGTWDDTNVTLTVLEHYVPKFFQGALALFQLNAAEIQAKNKNLNKPIIADDVKKMVRKNFTHEIEFYEFCKQRLYKQYFAIKLEKNKEKL